MYGLPPDFDTSIFLGRILEQVSFSANTIHFSFDDDLSITVESSFAHETAATRQQVTPITVPVAESKLMQLIGMAVQSASADEHGTLTLHFQDGQVLACFDDSAEFECYRITHGDTEIFV